MIRIASGFYKGRVLRGGKNSVIRPTMSKLKLTFFDILQHDVKEKIFLDGFAGTGNIGIEALSRGAEYVIFIDDLPEAARTIKHNAEKIGIASDFYRVILGDFNRSIIALAKDGFQFDLIYLDPPYAMLEYANPLKVIFKRNVLKKDGLIVLERPTQVRFETPYFTLRRSVPSGRESLDFFGY
ncbi:MAG: 16S rRNA (guanine(966)-N(2))-methyltransferase RsmD [Candidatus Aminicenantes bacterium]|nr:16S rRNA (guanine(966)-N(2))-methyltransferase RsmD [Candidatus Aminicenantes bacterium]